MKSRTKNNRHNRQTNDKSHTLSISANVPANVANTSGLFSTDQTVHILLTEYELLQQQSEFARQSRDTRVNWYTAIIGGTIAGMSLFFGQSSNITINPYVVEFIMGAVLAFLFIIGFFAFEAAQRYNLNDTASRIYMGRIRAYLCELRPELETKLNWGSFPHLVNYWPLWVPTITLTINSFVASICCGLLFYRLGVANGVWQMMAVGASLVFALAQIGFARVRYQKLRKKLKV